MKANAAPSPGRPGLSSGRFVFFLILLLIFIMAARAPIDSDLWWHLKAGEETWTTGRIVMQDSFSYTRVGAVWVNHSWLSQVGLYLAFRAGGYPALSFLMAFLAALSMGLVFWQMDGPPLLRAFILALAGVVASTVWTPRPQMASLVLLAGVAYLLWAYKWRKRDQLWMLIPLFILWSNLHGGYALGLILAGCMIGGEILNHLLGFSGEEVLPWKAIRKLGLWTVGAALVVALNPNGVQMWLIPFKTVGVNALQNLISEWASPDFHVLLQQSFLWLLLITLAAIGLSGRRLDGADLATLGVFAAMALVARRNFGPFAIVAAGVLSRHLWPALQAWIKRTRERGPAFWRRLINAQENRSKAPPRISPRLINAVILVLLTLVAGLKLYLVTSPELIATAISSSYPAGAVDWMQENHPAGRLFNSYNWGGYLIWANPGYPVFVDGRTDLYSDEIIGQWASVVAAQPGWKDILDKWDVRLALLEPDQPVVGQLEENGWRVYYQDGVSVLLGR